MSITHFNTMFSLEAVFHQFSTKGSAPNNSNSFFWGMIGNYATSENWKKITNFTVWSFGPLKIYSNFLAFTTIEGCSGSLQILCLLEIDLLGNPQSKFIGGFYLRYHATKMPVNCTQPQNHALLLSSIWTMVYLIITHVWKCMVLVLELCWSAARFLLRILCCTQSGNHPENNLAKFGYIIDMRIAKNDGIFLYSWLPSRSYRKTLEIWKFEIWQIFTTFSPWKILCIGQNHILQVEICPKFVLWGLLKHVWKLFFNWSFKFVCLGINATS